MINEWHSKAIHLKNKHGGITTNWKIDVDKNLTTVGTDVMSLKKQITF